MRVECTHFSAFFCEKRATEKAEMVISRFARKARSVDYIRNWIGVIHAVIRSMRHFSSRHSHNGEYVLSSLFKVTKMEARTFLIFKGNIYVSLKATVWRVSPFLSHPKFRDFTALSRNDVTFTMGWSNGTRKKEDPEERGRRKWERRKSLTQGSSNVRSAFP